LMLAVKLTKQIETTLVNLTDELYIHVV
jgi:hypothetical protein